MMPAQMPGDGTTGEHRQMLKLAKKFFAEQHAYLNQESYLDATAPAAFCATRKSLFPGFRHPFQDPRKYGVGIHSLRFRFKVEQHPMP